MRQLLAAAVGLATLAVTGVAASQILTECFSRQPGPGTAPKPIVAGFSKISVVAGGTQVTGESFFDGPLGIYINRLNQIAGMMDCDQDPDVRVVWGYTATDDNQALGAHMTVDVTYFRQSVAVPPQTCTHTSDPRLVQYMMDTTANPATRQSESGSLPFKYNLGPCNGNIQHFRAAAVVDSNLQNQVIQAGCFTVIEGGNSACDGAGAGCL